AGVVAGARADGYLLAQGRDGAAAGQVVGEHTGRRQRPVVEGHLVERPLEAGKTGDPDGAAADLKLVGHATDGAAVRRLPVDAAVDVQLHRRHVVDPDDVVRAVRLDGCR